VRDERTACRVRRCSTDQQDLTAQRDALLGLGVAIDRIYVNHGLTGTNRERPGAARGTRCLRAGDTLVTKLDRLARYLPDARAIADELIERQISLSLGGSVYDRTDAVGRLLFNVLAMMAEFESDLIRLRIREGMKVAKAKGRLARQAAQAQPSSGWVAPRRVRVARPVRSTTCCCSAAVWRSVEQSSPRRGRTTTERVAALLPVSPSVAAQNRRRRARWLVLAVTLAIVGRPV
jgi:hypothetical protein